jgi:hypothetical protein
MANSLSPAMQNSKIEVLEWLANEQDESFVQEIVSFIKKHTYERKVEEDFLKPMTEQELYDKIVKAQKSAAEGKVFTTAEMRERAKTWGR